MSETKMNDAPAISNDVGFTPGRRGFPGFRKPELISEEALNAALSRIAGGPSEEAEYIYYTGGPYNYRAPSMRSNALRTLKAVRVPVLLSEFLRGAARVVSAVEGYDPKAVRSGLYLHLGSKPAVYLALRRRADGAYVAARRVPYAYDPNNPSKYRKLEAGEVVIGPEEATEPATLSIAASSGGMELIEAPADREARAATKGKRNKK